ncbi:MAG: hypothetical protein KGP13_05580 [Burkholderiales bacterium]|nr:hypothetical protein [Burkholderiales bacterium]
MTHTNMAIKTNNHLAGYWLIFVMLFLVFMFLALAGKLMALNWRDWLPGAEGSTSTLNGVKSSVYTVISQLN